MVAGLGTIRNQSNPHCTVELFTRAPWLSNACAHRLAGRTVANHVGQRAHGLVKPSWAVYVAGGRRRARRPTMHAMRDSRKQTQVLGVTRHGCDAISFRRRRADSGPPLAAWGYLVVVGLGLGACDVRVAPQREWRPDDHGQPAAAEASDQATPPEPEQGGVERAADALYSISCASCHGADGRGQGAGRPPGAQLPDFTVATFQKQRSDAELLQVIRDGRGLMPPFGKQVNEQGQAALVAKIRRFAAPSEQ